MNIVILILGALVAFGVVVLFIKMGWIKNLVPAAIVFAILITLTIGTPKLMYAYFSDDHFIGKLVRMETPNEVGRSGPTVHMMYFKDVNGNARVVQNDDSILRWKWNSKDYRASEIGQMYQVHTQGYRFGLFSIQPNLLDMVMYKQQPVEVNDVK